MKRYIDQFVVGFALFSMFFGAGNIIFPPYLGLGSGSEWPISFACYYIADIGLAILAIFAIIRAGGDVTNITNRIGKIPGEILVSLIILCIGPFIALPRTGSTVYEMFVAPVFGEIPHIIPIILFFGISMLLTLKESAVVDIIGKFLTPLLFIGLLLLIVMGLITPIGTISPNAMLENVALEGINAGYQTMDVLAALIFGIIIFKSVEDKGYTDTKLKFATTRNASLIAAAGLLIVYCGLTYLGATASQLFNLNIGRSELISDITYGLLGEPGVVILGIIVTLACITTAIALITSTADYFSNLSKGKISYKLIVVLTSIISVLIAMIGTDQIVALASPVLNFIYPGALTLIILSFLGERISDFTLRFAVVGSIIGNLCILLCNHGLPLDFLTKLPFNSAGLGWIFFTILFGIIGAIIKKIKR